MENKTGKHVHFTFIILKGCESSGCATLFHWTCKRWFETHAEEQGKSVLKPDLRGVRNTIRRIARTRGVLALVYWLAVAPMMTTGLTAPANAQTASFRSVDKNSDGVLSFNELVAAFGRAGAKRLLHRFDHSGDGRLTISELRAGRGDRQDGGDRDAGGRDSDDRDNRESDDDGDDSDNGGGDGGESDGEDDD